MPTNISYVDLFALIGMMAYVVGNVLSYHNEREDVYVEVVQEAESDPRLLGTSSEAPRGTDRAQCEGETGQNVPDSRTAA